MNEYEIKNLKIGCFFSRPARLDEGFEILSPEMPLTTGLISILEKWRYTKIFSDGDPQDSYNPADMETELPINIIDKDEIDKAQFYINGLVSYVTSVFGRAKNNEKIEFNELAEKVKELCAEIKDNKKFLLQVRDYSAGLNSIEFYASHCVRTAIVSIIMGNYLKLPTYRLIELGVAALVHEIGMMRLPYVSYTNKAAITNEEQELIHQHPKLGFDILKNNNFPISVCAVALEHHERGSGTGYPRKTSKDLISSYSKIVAVACTYSALIEERPYREALNPCSGMTRMLRNEGGQFDENMIKTLIFSFSLYPIGQYVLLSDGNKGQVIDNNPQDPRYPIIQVLGVPTPDNKNMIIETSQDGIYIEKPINFSDVFSQ